MNVAVGDKIRFNHVDENNLVSSGIGTVVAVFRPHEGQPVGGSNYVVVTTGLEQYIKLDPISIVRVVEALADTRV